MRIKPCKVLHFIDSDGVYGAERVILNLSLEMNKARGYIPVVGCITYSDQSQNDLYDTALSLGLEALKIPISNTMLWRDIPRAAKFLKQSGIDLVHSHGYKPSVFGFAIRLLAGIPVIATCHLWFEPDKGPLKMRGMIWLEKRLYRWFPKVLAVSDAIKLLLLASGVKESQTEVVRNGVDMEEGSISELEKQQLRRELDLSGDTFCILNAGRLARQKAQHDLIEAASILKAAGKPIRVLIVGQGPLEQDLKQKIEDLAVEDCISLLGFRDDIDALLAIADVFALPSLDEGMPMSLLEAVAAKVPVVATGVGDVPKLIRHQQTGLIIPVGQPDVLASNIERLYNDALLAKQLAQRAFEEMQGKYSSAAMAARYITVYDELLNAGGGSL